MRLPIILCIVLFCSTHSTHAQGLDYVKNDGQWSPNILFKSNIPSGKLFVEKNSLTFKFVDGEAIYKHHHQVQKETDALFESYAYKLQFLNANLSSNVEGGSKKRAYHNYFISNDSTKWQSNVPLYSEVVVQSIYDNIDLRLTSKDSDFKYDFIISPGGEVSDVLLKYHSIVPRMSHGHLIFDLGFGTIVETSPFAYQIIDRDTVEVACEFRINNETVSFYLPNHYDPSFPLIIDPVLISSTLNGSSTSTVWAHTATYDLNENIFSGGRGWGIGYPTTLGAFQESFNGGEYDIGITKFNPDGSDLLWASYLGGSSNDAPHSLITDNDGNLYLYGSSNSIDFPCSQNAYDNSVSGGYDIIITQLSSDGTTILGSSYVGGGANDGINIINYNYDDSYRGEIYLDYENNIYISSFSSSNDFPTSVNAYQSSIAGGQDAVVFKLNNNLSNLIWSTYLGSTGNDAGYGLRVNENLETYVTGTAADGFPMANIANVNSFNGGEYDGFVVKINEIGTDLLTSRYFGSSSLDQSFFIDIDVDGDVYIFGQNLGNIPITPGYYGNDNSSQFLAKFDQNLDQVIWQTTIGSGNQFSHDFVPTAFMVDVCKGIYFSGHGGLNSIPNLYTTSDAFYTSGSFYLMVLDPDATEVKFASHYTGNHVDGGTSRFDPQGKIYQAVCSCGFLADGVMATTPNAYSTVQTTPCDIGVFKIDFESEGVNSVANFVVDNNNWCQPVEVTFENLSNGVSYLWNFGDDSLSTTTSPTYTYDEAGTYVVSLISIDSTTCNISDTAFFELNVLETSSGIQQQTSCDSFTWIDGNTYTSSNSTATHMLTNSVGCDSLVTLDLTILNSSDSTDTQIHCNSYTWIDGNTYTSSNNTATIMFTNSVGCDSLVTLDLTILNSNSGVDTQTHCDSYTWIDGNTYASSNNTATHMLTNSVGCDSLVTLDLTILNSSTGTDTQIHCNSYTWIDGNTYTSSNNTATHMLANSVGCDSLVTLDLTILNSSDSTDTQIHCNSYTWIDGNTYTSSNSTATILFTNSAGCDSLVTLDLTILNSTTGVDNQTHCDSYTWIDGNTYTSSNNTATHVLSNSVGCDSIVTLNLIINNSNTGTDAIIHCNSYVWIDGNTYISSNNTATYTLNNSQGCDSVVSLDLTILYSSTGVDTQVHCDEYTWINGRTYTSSNNTATFVLNNSIGCDSIVTLDLIINYSDSVIESHRACQRFYWSVNGVEYTQSGSYTVDSVNDFGCSYFGRLDLEIFEPTFVDDYVSSCGRYYWQKSGDYYQQSGVYTTILDGAPLCDTTATLYLNIESNSFFIPNTFTPNEDRKNEVFKMYSKNTIQNFEMWVFNRWGQELFYSTDINSGWNGMFKGQMSAIGVYAYMFKFNCSDESFVEVGTFTLIR